PWLVELGRCCPLELRLTLPNGDPAAFAEVTLDVLQPFIAGPWWYDRGCLRADHVGRVRVLVPSDAHLGLRIVHDGSMVLRGIATGGGRIADGPAVLALQLPPPATIHGRLVGAGIP